MGKKDKKKLKVKVAATIAATFTDLSKNISEKKFKRNVRNASEALLEGMKVPAAKKEVSPRLAVGTGSKAREVK